MHGSGWDICILWSDTSLTALVGESRRVGSFAPLERATLDSASAARQAQLPDFGSCVGTCRCSCVQRDTLMLWGATWHIMR